MQCTRFDAMRGEELAAYRKAHGITGGRCDSPYSMRREIYRAIADGRVTEEDVPPALARVLHGVHDDICTRRAKGKLSNARLPRMVSDVWRQWRARIEAAGGIVQGDDAPEGQQETGGQDAGRQVDAAEKEQLDRERQELDAAKEQLARERQALDEARARLARNRQELDAEREQLAMERNRLKEAKPIKETRKHRVQLVVTESLFDAMQRLKISQGISFNELANRLFEEAVKRQ